MRPSLGLLASAAKPGLLQLADLYGCSEVYLPHFEEHAKISPFLKYFSISKLNIVGIIHVGSSMVF